MLYLMCYDVSDPKRLKKTAKVLESYGLRIQKSFFQAELSPELLEVITRRVLRIIKVKYDRFFIYPLCESCSYKAIKDGTGELVKLEAYEIL